MFQRILLATLMFLMSDMSLAAIPEQKELVFEIYRNDKPFGEHVISFDLNGDEIKTDIKILMEYKVGPLALFRYKHENHEVYKKGKLIELSARTYDNGNEIIVEAKQKQGSLVVENPDSIIEVRQSIVPTTYWDEDMLKQSYMLNTQYGSINDVSVEELGVENYQLSDKTIEAKKYLFKDLDADRQATVWYDKDTKQWVGLAFEIRGSKLEYKRVTPLTKNIDTGIGE